MSTYVYLWNDKSLLFGINRKNEKKLLLQSKICNIIVHVEKEDRSVNSIVNCS